MPRIYLYKNGDITFSEGKGNPDISYLQEIGNCQKSYCLTTTNYRTILSAAVNLVERRQHSVIFLTFTFPFDIAEKQANQVIKLFFKNAVRYDNFESYIWTKERQQNGRIHFHALADFPYTSIAHLQGTYNECIHRVCGVRPDNCNSLRLPPHHSKRVGVEIIDTIKYMAKYITKERGKIYSQPVYAISKSLIDVKRELTSDEAILLIAESGICYRRVYEHFAVVGLVNRSNKPKKSSKDDQNTQQSILF